MIFVVFFVSIIKLLLWYRIALFFFVAIITILFKVQRKAYATEVMTSRNL